jgi:hypothetical protein
MGGVEVHGLLSPSLSSRGGEGEELKKGSVRSIVNFRFGHASKANGTDVL